MGEWAHPGYQDNIPASGKKGSTSTAVVGSYPLKASISSETNDKTATGYAGIWEFYPTYAKMTLTKSGATSYWFLYEGQPGGGLDVSDATTFLDYYMTPAGTKLNASNGNGWREPNGLQPQWVYFGDKPATGSGLNRVFFLAHHEDDNIVDGYYSAGSSATDSTKGMAIFGFGRYGGTASGATTRYMTANNQHFTLGFAETTDFATAKKIIEGNYRDLKITVDPPAQLPFTTSPTISSSGYALGSPTVFTATVNSAGVVYTWDFGDGATGITGAVVPHTYASGGAYNVSVTASNSASTQTNTASVTIVEPIAGLSAANSSPVLLGSNTAFSATVTGGDSPTYVWDFGDGSATKTGQNVSYKYLGSGTFTAKVTASNAGNSLTAQTTVVVNKAIAGLTATNSGQTVLNKTIYLTATVSSGDNVVYTWDFGDGSATGAGQNVTHKYTAAGNFTAKVTAQNGGGSPVTAQTSVIVNNPITGLVATTSGASVPGNTVFFSATLTTGENVTYLWDFGDGSATVAGQNVTHKYAVAGNFTAKVTAQNGGSPSSAETSLTINAPIADLAATNNGPTTLGNPTSFNASITAGDKVTYLWDFGDGTEPVAGQSVTHQYAAAGNFTAKVTARNGGAPLTANTNVVITAPPVPPSPTSTPTPGGRTSPSAATPSPASTSNSSLSPSLTPSSGATSVSNPSAPSGTSAIATLTVKPTMTNTPRPTRTKTPTPGNIKTASATPTATLNKSERTATAGGATLTRTRTPNPSASPLSTWSPMVSPTSTSLSLPAPMVLNVDLVEGWNDQALSLTIFGKNFVAKPTVALNNSLLTDLSFLSSTQLRVTIPAGWSPGVYDLVVTNPDGAVGILPAAFTVQTKDLFLIKISPEQGRSDRANEISINGLNFAAGAIAQLDTTVLTTTWITTTQIRVLIPAGTFALGSHDLTVFNPDGQSAFLPQAYRVLKPTSDLLFATNSDLWSEPPTLRAQSKAKLGLRVCRQNGQLSFSEVEVAFYLGDPNQGGQYLGDGLIPSLAPNSCENTLPIQWTPPKAGNYPLYAVLDPDNTFGDASATDNTVSQNLTILPAVIDQTPPHVDSFKINGGAAATTSQNVTLNVTASDDDGQSAKSVIFIEFEYNQSLNQWVSTQKSPWLDYATTQNGVAWKLLPSSGVKYLQAWAADAVGNISLVSQEAFINFVQPKDAVEHGQARVYRYNLQAGQRFKAQLRPLNGDPDLYLWPPDFAASLPPWYSNLRESTDAVDFIAPFDGIYQLEIYGYTDASYQIEINPGATLSEATLGGIDSTKPLRSQSNLAIGSEPNENQKLPAVPAALAPADPAQLETATPVPTNTPVLTATEQPTALPASSPQQVFLPLIMR